MQEEELINKVKTKIDELEEREFFDMLFSHRGVVYGGFLRDVVSNETPKDFDVVISILYSSDFDADITKLGYKGTYNPNNDTMLWIKKGHFPVESYAVEDDPDEVIIGPVAAPDYDVNLLIYDGNNIRSWIDPSSDITPIIKNIRNKIAVEFTGDEVNPQRRAKMIAKGYKIV